MEQGALTEAVYYILLSLIEPMHGYGIMQKVEEMSKGRVRLAAGTLYGALNTLLDKDWIEALNMQGEDRKKNYKITYLGCNALHSEMKRLDELIKNGTMIMEALGNEKECI